MKSLITQKSPALQFIHTAWEHLPRASWQRLNSAMFKTLKIAVVGGMKFEPGDFTHMQGIGRWLSGGDEGIYSLACGEERGTENPSAAISMETSHFKRPAYLWEEETKTPQRLHVGAWFSWHGDRVKVTSMSSERIVACYYKDRDERTPTRRYAITLDELNAERKRFKDRRKAIEKEIEACETVQSLNAIATDKPLQMQVPYLRHFDVEAVREQFSIKMRALQEGAGHQGRALDDEEHVTLRVSGDWVHASNGQRATLADVQRALPFILSRRNKPYKRKGEAKRIDSFIIEKISQRGVQVGCTFIAWAEVERFANALLELANS